MEPKNLTDEDLLESIKILREKKVKVSKELTNLDTELIYLLLEKDKRKLK